MFTVSNPAYTIMVDAGFVGQNVRKIFHFPIKFARKYIDNRKGSNYTDLVCIRSMCLFGAYKLIGLHER